MLIDAVLLGLATNLLSAAIWERLTAKDTYLERLAKLAIEEAGIGAHVGHRRLRRTLQAVLPLAHEASSNHEASASEIATGLYDVVSDVGSPTEHTLVARRLAEALVSCVRRVLPPELQILSGQIAAVRADVDRVGAVAETGVDLIAGLYDHVNESTQFIVNTVARSDLQLVPDYRTEVVSYRHLHSVVVGREAELDTVSARLGSADGPDVVVIEGDAFVGKTAFVTALGKDLESGGVQVIYFYVSERTSDTAHDFLGVALGQVLTLLGEPRLVPTDHASRRILFDVAWQRLLDESSGSGKRVVMLVDGLDEQQRSAGPMISDVLPGSYTPHVRLVATSRPSPELRPPRGARVTHIGLAASERSASDAAGVGEVIRRALLTPGADRVLACLVAARAPIGTADLAAVADVEQLVVRHAFGPLERHLRYTEVDNERRIALGHVEYSRRIQTEVGKGALTAANGRFVAWAETWRAGGWPSNTPVFLLDSAAMTFVLNGDLAAAGALLYDRGWISRAVAALGTPFAVYPALRAAQLALAAHQPAAIALGMNLAVVRHEIAHESPVAGDDAIRALVVAGKSELAETIGRAQSDRGSPPLSLAVALLDVDADRAFALLAEQAESAGGGLRTLLPFLSADFRRTIDVMLGVKAIIPLLEPMIEAARFVAANHSDTVPELLDRLGPDRQHYVVGSLAVECLEAGDVEGARRWLGFSAPRPPQFGRHMEPFQRAQDALAAPGVALASLDGLAVDDRAMALADLAALHIDAEFASACLQQLGSLIASGEVRGRPGAPLAAALRRAPITEALAFWSAVRATAADLDQPVVGGLAERDFDAALAFVRDGPVERRDELLAQVVERAALTDGSARVLAAADEVANEDRRSAARVRFYASRAKSAPEEVLEASVADPTLVLPHWLLSQTISRCALHRPELVQVLAQRTTDDRTRRAARAALAAASAPSDPTAAARTALDAVARPVPDSHERLEFGIWLAGERLANGHPADAARIARKVLTEVDALPDELRGAMEKAATERLAPRAAGLLAACGQGDATTILARLWSTYLRKRPMYTWPSVLTETAKALAVCSPTSLPTRLRELDEPLARSRIALECAAQPDIDKATGDALLALAKDWATEVHYPVDPFNGLFEFFEYAIAWWNLDPDVGTGLATRMLEIFDESHTFDAFVNDQSTDASTESMADFHYYMSVAKLSALIPAQAEVRAERLCSETRRSAAFQVLTTFARPSVELDMYRRWRSRIIGGPRDIWGAGRSVAWLSMLMDIYEYGLGSDTLGGDVLLESVDSAVAGQQAHISLFLELAESAAARDPDVARRALHRHLATVGLSPMAALIPLLVRLHEPALTTDLALRWWP